MLQLGATERRRPRGPCKTRWSVMTSLGRRAESALEFRFAVNDSQRMPADSFLRPDHGGSNPCGSIRPSPSHDLRHIDPVFIRIVAAIDLHVAIFFLGMRTDALQLARAVDHIDGKAETVD